MRHYLKLLLLLALTFPAWAAAQEVCLTAEQYAAITYSWTGADGVTHNDVPITEKATDPNQIYELLRTIYCDERVPGPYYTSYDADGNREREVLYGAQFHTNTTATYSKVNNQQYAMLNNNGGWMITDQDPSTYKYEYRSYWSTSYYPLQDGYKQVKKPLQEGYTVLIVAVKNNLTHQGNTGSTTFANKAELIFYISNNIESVELLTNGMRLGSDADKSRGTVYSLDGTYNRFFFISKGQSRKNKNVTYNSVPFLHMFEEFSPTDGTEGSEVKDYYYNMKELKQPFGVQHDCESVIEAEHFFCMNGKAGTEAKQLTGLNFFIPDYRLMKFERDDLYPKDKEIGSFSDYNGTYVVYMNEDYYYHYDDGRDMNPGKSYVLSCYYYNNYGEKVVKSFNFSAADSYSQYAFYNTEHQPQTMLYNITLTAERSDEVDADGNYLVTLKWESSLDELNKNHVYQRFNVYRYVTDPVTGARSKQLLGDVTTDGVDYANPTYGYEWKYTVPQKQSSYLITYVVEGIPVEKATEDTENENYYNFRVTPSNDARVAFPGTDKLEALSLEIKGKYESEFDVQNEVNKYKNYVSMSDGLGSTKLTPAHLNGDPSDASIDNKTTFILYRDSNVPAEKLENNELTDRKEKVATLVVTKTATGPDADNQYTYNFHWKITYENEAAGVTYPEKEGNLNAVYGTSTTLSFGTIEFLDAFEASTAKNDHPNRYYYQVQFDAAAALGSEAGEKAGHSNVADVPVHKTKLDIKGAQYSADDVYNVDIDHSLEVNTADVNMEMTAFDEDVLYYTVSRFEAGTPHLNNEITRAMRQADGSYQAEVKNQSEWSNLGDPIEFPAGESSVQVPMQDVAPMTDASNICYVPWVTAYRPMSYDMTEEEQSNHDAEYNTYGAPIENFGLGKVEITDWHGMSNGSEQETPLRSEYTWTEDGQKYCYYSVCPVVKGQVPEGYEIVGFRAWRICESAHENHQYTDSESKKFVPSLLKRQQDGLNTELGWLLESDFGEKYYDGIKQTATIGITPVNRNDENPVAASEIYGEYTSSFGAPYMEQGLPTMKFIVRMYYRVKDLSKLNHAPRRAVGDDSKYFVVECTGEPSGAEVVTGISGVKSDAEVQSVMYYNTVGMASTQPWSGVNIAVTRYADGTSSTTKVVR